MCLSVARRTNNCVVWAVGGTDLTDWGVDQFMIGFYVPCGRLVLHWVSEFSSFLGVLH